MILPALIVFNTEPKYLWGNFQGAFLLLAFTLTVAVIQFAGMGTGTFLSWFGCYALLVIGIRTYHQWQNQEFHNYWQVNFNLRYGLVALFCAVIGVASRTFQSYRYWIMHGFWHLFVMLSVYFANASGSRSATTKWMIMPKANLRPKRRLKLALNWQPLQMKNCVKMLTLTTIV